MTNPFKNVINVLKPKGTTLPICLLPLPFFTLTILQVIQAMRQSEMAKVQLEMADVQLEMAKQQQDISQTQESLDLLSFVREYINGVCNERCGKVAPF